MNDPVVPAGPPEAVQVAEAAADWVRVRLIGVELACWEDSDQHHVSVLREAVLIAGSQPEDKAMVPARLLALVDRLQGDYSASAAALEAMRARAVAEGRPALDLEVPVPASAGPASAELAALLEELDQFCESGALLTLKPGPTAVQFRRWYLGQFADQVRGADPVSWPAWRAAHPAPTPA